MKLLLLAVLVAVASAAKVTEDAGIVKKEYELNEDGSYKFSFETSDGILHEEKGQGGVSAEGKFSYTDEEGNKWSVAYVADENGFQPTGDHIHPVPELIAKALKQTGVLKRRR